MNASRIPASRPGQNTQTLATQVPQSVKDRVRRWARRRGLSEAEAVRRLLAAGLEVDP